MGLRLVDTRRTSLVEVIRDDTSLVAGVISESVNILLYPVL
jgi:hypothetical protein